MGCVKYSNLLIGQSLTADPMNNLLKNTSNGSELIESKDTIIINLTNNFVENKEEASHGTLMAKVSISITMMIVIVFQFQ